MIGIIFIIATAILLLIPVDIIIINTTFNVTLCHITTIGRRQHRALGKSLVRDSKPMHAVAGLRV